MENDIDLAFAILSADPFGYAIPEDVDYCEFDVALDAVGTSIFNFYHIDS